MQEVLAFNEVDQTITVQAEYGVLRTLKTYFDPDFLMNPGGTLGLDLMPEQKRFLREHKEYTDHQEA